MIKGVKFVTIPVRDQKKAVAFWTEKLGFQVFTDQPFNDQQRWVELGIPGAPTRVVPFLLDGWEDRIGKFLNVVFYSDNVEKTYQELTSKGVEFLAPPKKEDWGTSSIFKDQDGNQFVLSSK
jgi:catechol 2,3-dioxygenase-like lactoylglutathione lyase family enzyme